MWGASPNSSGVVDGDANRPTDQCGMEGHSDFLTEMLWRGDEEELEEHYSGGGDPNLIDAEGYTPLHRILGIPGCREDRSDLVRLLIRHGANVNQPMTSYTQMTPLHYAEFVGEASVLLEAGADIDSLNSEGIPPLAQCFIREVEGGFDVLRFYMRRGADVSLLEMDRIKAEILEEQDFIGMFHEDTGKCLGLLAAVKSAGSYRRYVAAPRAALMRLRTLCARGRATPPHAASGMQTISVAEMVIFERLFAFPSSPTTKTKAARRPLPNEVFWHVLSFWRSSRDD